MIWFVYFCATLTVTGTCTLERRIQCVDEAQCIRTIENLQLPEGSLAYYFTTQAPAAPAAPPSKEPTK